MNTIEIVKEMLKNKTLETYTPTGDIEYKGKVYQFDKLSTYDALNDAIYCHNLIEDVRDRYNNLIAVIVPTTSASVDIHFVNGGFRRRIIDKDEIY